MAQPFAVQDLKWVGKDDWSGARAILSSLYNMSFFEFKDPSAKTKLIWSGCFINYFNPFPLFGSIPYVEKKDNHLPYKGSSK